jgi:hypothetical protein
LLNGVGENSRFCGFCHPILWVRFTPVAVEQCFDTAFGNGILITVEGVTGQAHHLASF